MVAKQKNRILVGVMAILLLALSLWCWCKKPEDFSESERRVLADFPKVTWETVSSGRYMEEFEAYAVDQFPRRDSFRSLKSAVTLGGFRQLDNNGLYLENDYICKQEYPLNVPMLDNAADRFRYLYDNYMADKDMKLYFSIVPDKNYFLAKEHGALSLDYAQLIDYMKEKTAYMEYIDIAKLLTIKDYYRTDTHWRQESLPKVADRLAEQMGISLQEDYTIKHLEHPFYGVYYGQLALPVAPDTIQYLMSDTLENCIVTSYDRGSPVEKSVYDMEKAGGRDAYEMFLSGSEALMTIENPNASSEKELMIFRDSFGSSLTPLLVEGYRKITLVDIRYVESEALGEMIDFEDQDVLFLYSTLLLNNSLALK